MLVKCLSSDFEANSVEVPPQVTSAIKLLYIFHGRNLIGKKTLFLTDRYLKILDKVLFQTLVSKHS